MLKNTYAIANDIVPSDLCDEIVRIGELFPNMEATVGGDSALTMNSRSSRVSWFDQHSADLNDYDLQPIYDAVNDIFQHVCEDAEWDEIDITDMQAFQLLPLPYQLGFAHSILG